MMMKINTLQCTCMCNWPWHHVIHIYCIVYLVLHFLVRLCIHIHVNQCSLIILQLILLCIIMHIVFELHKMNSCSDTNSVASSLKF